MDILGIIEKYRSWAINERDMSPRSVETYLYRILRALRENDIKTIQDINPDKIKKNFNLEIFEALTNGKPLSRNSRIVYLSAIKSFLKFLFIKGYTEENYSENIEIPKKEFVYLEGLNEAEQKKLREYLSQNLATETDRRNAALIYFLWSTATRISEALKLRVHGDCYIYTHDPTIRSGDFEVSPKDGKVYVHINGKGKRNRKIIVSDEAIAYINFYLQHRKIKNEILFLGVGNFGSIKPISYKTALWNIQRVFKKAGLEKPIKQTSHVFRHTAINHWIDQGIPIQKILAMTGHSTEIGLEPYFRRRKELTRSLGDEYSPIRIKNLDSRIKKFEEILKERYAQIKSRR